MTSFASKRSHARFFGAWRLAFYAWRHKVRSPIQGRFQPYNHTLPDRYPWLFRFAAEELGSDRPLNILSFGCSRGDEVFTLRDYFPRAAIKGIDFQRRNIARCRARARGIAGVQFAVAANIRQEPALFFDAIFCLGVLCHGYLTRAGAPRSDPLLRFTDFEEAVASFARCLKPGGLLLLHATNFRLCDAASAADFDVVLEAELDQLAPDVLFDRNNVLMRGVRYRPVAFRKRAAQ